MVKVNKKLNDTSKIMKDWVEKKFNLGDFRKLFQWTNSNGFQVTEK